MSDWQDISTAPKDGTRVRGRQIVMTNLDGTRPVSCDLRRNTFWGKTSHIPIYGWNYGRDPEDQNIWYPTHWQRLPEPPVTP